jgi:hypothetical protein
MPTRSSKRPQDANQLAKHIVDIATGEAERDDERRARPKNPAAVALGKLGGRKGGKARAESLTPTQRTEISRAAAKARWETRKNAGSDKG